MVLLQKFIRWSCEFKNWFFCLFFIVWWNSKLCICPLCRVWIWKFTNNVSPIPVQMPNDPPPHDCREREFVWEMIMCRMSTTFQPHLHPPKNCAVARFHSGWWIWPVRYVQSPLNRIVCNCNWLLFLAATPNNLPLRANCVMARVNNEARVLIIFFSLFLLHSITHDSCYTVVDVTQIYTIRWNNIVFEIKYSAITRWNRLINKSIVWNTHRHQIFLLFFLYDWHEWQHIVHWASYFDSSVNFFFIPFRFSSRHESNCQINLNRMCVRSAEQVWRNFCVSASNGYANGILMFRYENRNVK